MKKRTKNILAVLITIAVLSGWYYYYRIYKFQCQTDNDCIMSIYDPEKSEICVNKSYYNFGPKIRGGYDCLSDKNISCSCKQNKCVRTDGSSYGC